jgi:hypothetical protein
MQFNIDTSYRSRYQLNKSKLKIRGYKQSPSYLHDLISTKDQKYNFRHQDKAVLPRV